MEEINLVFDIDDLNPSKGWGIEKDAGNYKYITKLQNEFPNLKITFFVPANFENRADLRLNKDWVEWLKNKKNIEIACHGLTHYNQNNKQDVREFANITPWEADFKLREAKKIFEEVGFKVKGVKAGGWDIIQEFYPISAQYFNYMADHFIGYEPQKIGPNYFRVPYTYSIDDIGPKYYNNIILHGHFSELNGNKNALSQPIYLALRSYLADLERKFKVNYLTMSELVEKYNVLPI